MLGDVNVWQQRFFWFLMLNYWKWITYTRRYQPFMRGKSCWFAVSRGILLWLHPWKSKVQPAEWTWGQKHYISPFVHAIAEGCYSKSVAQIEQLLQDNTWLTTIPSFCIIHGWSTTSSRFLSQTVLNVSCWLWSCEYLNVWHLMEHRWVSHILRWGNREQKATMMPRLWYWGP